MKRLTLWYLAILAIVITAALTGCITKGSAEAIFGNLKDDPSEFVVMSPWFSITRKMPKNWVPPARATQPSESPTVHVIVRTNAPQ